MPTSATTCWVSFGVVLVPIATGVILGRAFRKIGDKSIAICLLYFFLPVYMFQLLATPLNGGKELVLVFFFLFFHTAALLILGVSVLRMIGFPLRTHSLILFTMLLSHPCLFPPQLAHLFIGDIADVQSAARILDIALLAFVTVGGYLASPRTSAPERLFDMIRLPIAPFALLGFLFALLGISLGPSITSTLEPLSQAAAPFTFLLLGILIGKEFYLFELPSLTPTLFAVGIATILRLVVSPILAVVLTKLMSEIDASLGRMLILHTAMPTSALTAVLLAFYGQTNDKRYVALCIIATVLLSCVTIPLVLLFVGP